MAYLQQDFRLLCPAFVFPVQESIKESQLLLAAIVGVEVRPVLDAMCLQPFVLGGGSPKALEISARVQALAAPIGGGEQWRGDLAPFRRARLVLLLSPRMRSHHPHELR